MCTHQKKLIINKTEWMNCSDGRMGGLGRPFRKVTARVTVADREPSTKIKRESPGR